MAENRQLEILSELLVTAERNFEATVNHAAAVDDKAQKTSGMASIFLALAFGFVKPQSMAELREDFGNTSLGLLCVVLFLLVASVIVCLLAMWQRKVPIGGISLEAHQEAADVVLAFAPDMINDELIYYYRTTQVDIWRAATEERLQVNAAKDRLVLVAQNILGAGILVAVLNIGLMGFQLWRNAVVFK
jgi:hypothetical protein